MKIECINCSYVEITDDDGSKYCLASDIFLNIIEEQKKDIKSNSPYPYIYGTAALQSFYDTYPECCI
ncbi:hypothetical protein WCX18_06935 [Sulfurimonas sp. HSL1-2]|uniref:hypothetical protein n=1 Tax=Thiomicrolovo zhangzhouensis TaxID=3131933 RepID=UPI0031F7837F